jgi:hypothetical protein
MLKNLAHYDTIVQSLQEDFEIEIESLGYEEVETETDTQPDLNFLELILDLITSAELIPELTLFENLDQTTQLELLQFTEEEMDSLELTVKQNILCKVDFSKLDLLNICHQLLNINITQTRKELIICNVIKQFNELDHIYLLYGKN